MKRGTVVVFESTVYPGATERVCVPVLEKFSGLQWKRDFNVGYSPERINPGDKKLTLTQIVKLVSGDTPETLANVSAIYGAIISAGVFEASSIRVAEAAKVIENTQRDPNIALTNELSLIFNRMGKYVAEQTIKQLVASGRPVKDANVIVLGMTFKEDCADVPSSPPWRTRPTCAWA